MTDFDLGDPAPDADEEPDDESEVTEENTPSDPPETPDGPESPEPEPEPEPEPADDADESDGEQPDPTKTGPAFPYSEVKQSPLYAREETWKQFDLEVDTTVVPELRKMDIFDDELREIHDVALEIVLDNLDEIPERLAEKRRQSR